MARYGVLTGGGDCAGLDAIIRAVVRRGSDAHGDDFLGIRRGFRGLLDGDLSRLDVATTSGILTRGGTLLGTSRTDPLERGEAGLAQIRQSMEHHGLEALVVIGGDGTLRGARDLADAGVPLLGVPKTIDNDVVASERSVGFETAVQVATDAIDRLQTTAESHDRVMVVEVMGRHVGWIATLAGLAGGADAILVPEQPWSLEELCAGLSRRHGRGHNHSIVVVAEGAGQSLDHGAGVSPAAPSAPVPSGIGMHLQDEIEARTGFETRTTILGHVLRGGSPCAADRILATRFGIAAADAAHAGIFGTLTALVDSAVVQVPLDGSLDVQRPVDPRLLAAAEVFCG